MRSKCWPSLKKGLAGLYFILLLLSGTPLLASGPPIPRDPATLGGSQQFLPVDQAFQLGAIWQGDTITVRWYARPGYYLYRHRLSFSSPNARLGKPEIPQGQPEDDPYFGKVEIYRGDLLVKIPVVKSAKTIALDVGYQGCADAGYCYPPQKRQINLVKAQ